MPITVPPLPRRQARGIESWDELTRWGVDIDTSLAGVIRALQDAGRMIDLLSDQTTTGTVSSVAHHAASHLPGGSDPLNTASAGTIQPDDGASAGSAAAFARSDHRHAIVAAAAGTISPDDSAAEGTATSFARSDHRHAITTDAPVALGSALAEGSASAFARSDHVHTLHANLSLSLGTISPASNGGVDCGGDSLGWGGLWIKDTSAAFEDRLIFTSTTALTADRVLTVDLDNGSRTLKLTGNVTGNQDVSTTGTPQFARAGVGQAADGTVLLAVNDATSAPASNVSTGVVNRYGGDSNFCGDPSSWLRIRVGFTTYKIPLFA